VRREETVRLVEYAPFPRVHRDPQWRQGFTLDLSPRGLCVRAKEVAPIDSLLRIIVRSVDGRPALEAVARVAWVARSRAGDPRMGLEIVAARERAPVRVAAATLHAAAAVAVQVAAAASATGAAESLRAAGPLAVA
jgi:hypothetical protein